MTEITRLSSLDSNYTEGALSAYPVTVDTQETLYLVTNNAETQLTQTLPFLGQVIVVADTSAFPPMGILRIGPPAGESGNFELVYYAMKTSNTFQMLARGFAKSSRTSWPVGSNVLGVVGAETHNAIKDALINIENNLGVSVNPVATSLNGILHAQETKFLNPRVIFRAFPISGAAPLSVRFQDFSTGDLIRYFWDFGDGSTSILPNPIHVYQTEGIYSVTLNIMTSTGGQAVATKNNYITVNNELQLSFFYITPVTGLSTASANQQNLRLPPDEQVSPTQFIFVDQTDGNIVQRNWIFGDNIQTTENDSDIHTTTHIYSEAGTYNPVLVLVFQDGSLRRLTLVNPIIVN